MWKKILAIVFGALLGYWLIDDFNPDSLKGKRVFVTGASTGIGEQLAYHYARLGANVVVTARRENRLKQVVEKCRELGADNQKFGYVVADMADLNNTANVIRDVVKQLGGLDYIVLNHIILLDLGVWTGTRDNVTLIDKVMKVNFQSYVRLASYALPDLEKTKGSILVVSSLAGKVGQPFVSIYSGSKFALDGFFGGLRQELKLRNCDVSITMCVLGLIGTDNALTALQNFGQNFLLSMVKAESPSDTALAMIKAGTRRVREMYYPVIPVYPMTLLRDWFPETIEYFNRVVYTLNS